MRPRRTTMASLDMSPDQRTWRDGDLEYVPVLRASADEPNETYEYGILFAPVPDAAYVVHVYFADEPPALADDDATSWVGDDEYVVLDVMLKCLVKEESDPSAVAAQKQIYLDQMTQRIAPVDLSQPLTVTDARSWEVRASGSDIGDWWRR